jgi:hypothetical protein
METALDSFLHVVATLFPDESSALSEKFHSRFKSPPTGLVAQSLNFESLTDAEVRCNGMPLAHGCIAIQMAG